MKNLKFSHEPIAYIGLFLVIMQVVQAVTGHQGIDVTLINSFITALGTVVGRSLVSPVATNAEEEEDAK